MVEDDSNTTLMDFDQSAGDEGVDGDDGVVSDVDEGVDGDDGVVSDVDERVDGDVGEGGDGDADEGEVRDDAGEAVREPGSVSPAASTSRFATDGESCAACGASTRRLWLAEGDAVCVDCKPW